MAGREGGGHAGVAAARGHAAYGADRRRGAASRPRSSRRAAASSTPSKSTAQPRRRAARPPAASSRSSGKLKFVFVNHVTTNPFFVPTQYGAEDACKLLGCSLPVDRLGEHATSTRWSTRSTPRSPAARTGSRSRWSTRRRSTRPTDAALKAKIPVVAYNADAHEQRAPGLHRPGPVRLRPGDGQADRAASCRRATSRCSSRRPARRTSSRASTARSSVLKIALRRSRPHVIATGAAVPAELSVIDSYATGPPGHQGLLRRRRRQHAGPRADDPEAQPALQGRQGRRLRPHADHAEAAGRRPDRLHDRPAAVPAGLPPGPAAVPVQGVGHAVGHRRRQHRPEVPRQDDGRPLQQHEEPLRGHLVGRRA